MIFGSNSTRVFVAKNCARTSGLTIANLASTLGQGEILVTDDKGAILVDAAAAKKAKAIRLHVGIGDGKAVVSDLIRAKDVLRFSGTKFVQQREKKVFIGWNGTAGDIQAIDSNEYKVQLELKSASKAQMAHPLVVTTSYTSPSSGTSKFEVANNIAQILTLNFSQFEPAIKVNVIGNLTTGGGVTGGAVETGSRAISYTGGTAAIGDVISVPGAADAGYGAESASLYKIIDIDTTNKVITIDKPYQNVAQTGLAITVVSVFTAVGIELQGVRQSFRLGYGDLVPIDWDTLASNFGTTLITVCPLIPATGRHEQVGMQELMFQGTAGRFQDNEFQYHTPQRNFTELHGYSCINIVYGTNERTNTLERNGQPKSLLIFLDRGLYSNIGVSPYTNTTFLSNIITGTGADTVDGDSLINVLNAFMVGAGVISTGLNTNAGDGLSLKAATTYATGVDL